MIQIFLVLVVQIATPLWASDKPTRTICERIATEADAIYESDDVESLKQTIESRKALYRPELRKEWQSAEAKFYRNAEGEEILDIEGFEVMRGFEKPYMDALAEQVVSRGGRVLNVGFGLGIIDSKIEALRGSSGITEHHIIELNRDVYNKALEWREKQPGKEKIFIHLGDWADVLVQLKTSGLKFDGVVYDAFPLEVQDIHRDFVPFFDQLIEHRLVRGQNSIVTFYLDSVDGLGKGFRKYLSGKGVAHVDERRVEVALPKEGTQYWNRPYFYVPILTGINASLEPQK